MSFAINIICEDKPGMLRDIAGVVAEHGGNIVYTQQFVLDRGVNKGKGTVYMEIEGMCVAALRGLLRRSDRCLSYTMSLCTPPSRRSMAPELS